MPKATDSIDPQIHKNSSPPKADPQVSLNYYATYERISTTLSDLIACAPVIATLGAATSGEGIGEVLLAIAAVKCSVELMADSLPVSEQINIAIHNSMSLLTIQGKAAALYTSVLADQDSIYLAAKLANDLVDLRDMMHNSSTGGKSETISLLEYNLWFEKTMSDIDSAISKNRENQGRTNSSARETAARSSDFRDIRRGSEGSRITDNPRDIPRPGAGSGRNAGTIA